MLKKILSVFLVILLGIQVLPMNVFAEELSQLDAENEAVSADSFFEQEESEPYVLYEDTEKRDENTKHFRLSDGTYKAVSYSDPVHYRKNERSEWKEIDNTLIENRDEEGNDKLDGCRKQQSRNLYSLNRQQLSWGKILKNCENKSREPEGISKINSCKRKH